VNLGLHTKAGHQAQIGYLNGQIHFFAGHHRCCRPTTGAELLEREQPDCTGACRHDKEERSQETEGITAGNDADCGYDETAKDDSYPASGPSHDV
jgi:hypothetical protein